MFRILFLLTLCLLCAVPARAFDEDHTETINGASLHFRVRGTDKSHPYLLLLHGGPGFSAHIFYGWGTSLEKDVNVVYLDQRGSGQSARLTFANPYAPTPDEVKGYTIANLVGDIEGVRTFLKVDKWYVLGHSWGGMLGLEYVTAHPEHVRGFIDMDGLVSVPAMQNAILDNAEAKFNADPKANAALLAQVAQLRALPPDNPQRLFGAFGLALGPAGLYFAGDQAKLFPAFRAQVAAAVKPYSIPEAALSFANEPAGALIVNDNFLTRDDTPLLTKVSVPTLVINGKQDGVVPPLQAQAAHAAIKGSQIVILDNCGHFPFAEQPALTTDAVLHFVQKGRTSQRKPQYTNMVSREGSLTNLPRPRLPRHFDLKTVPNDCTIAFTIMEGGSIDNMSVKQSSGNAAFDAACVDAITKAKAMPAYQDGVAYKQRMEQTFSPH